MSFKSLLVLSCICIFFVGGVLSACTTSGANLVQNGDFEVVVGTTNADCEFMLDVYNNCPLDSPDSTTLDHWNLIAGGISLIKTPKWVAQSGSICVGLCSNNNGKITQEVSGLTVGNKYQLSFQLAGNPIGSSIKQMKVQFSTVVNDSPTFDISASSFF